MSVIQISASYRLAELKATVHLEAELYPGIFVSILHEGYQRDLLCSDFADTLDEELTVKQGESLTIIARHEGRIVASLVNEVETSERSRQLLLPKGGFNLLIHQVCLEPDGIGYPLTPKALRPPTISTHLIGKATSFLKQLHIYHNLYPPVFQLILPTLDEVVKTNDEQRSREALGPLLEALVQTNLNRYPGLEIICSAMQERLAE